MKKAYIIAIDGPSGAGKSTVARGLAKALDYQFIDTGALYRSVAKLADDNNISWDDGQRLAENIFNYNFSFDSQGNLSVNGTFLGDSIRTSRIASGASEVAGHKEVRDALLAIQRNLGKNGRVVLEGRDIGTTVFPNADFKFYLTASVKTRAYRRYLELKQKGEEITLEQVEADQEARDKADMEREISPLLRAYDAIDVNCDNLDANDVVAFMVSEVLK
jgi:cytidylate kinase